MNLSTITKNILLNLKEEIEKEDNIQLIKEDILKPLIQHIMRELYVFMPLYLLWKLSAGQTHTSICFNVEGKINGAAAIHVQSSGTDNGRKGFWI